MKSRYNSIAAAIALVSASSLQAAEPERPNVVLIVADDLGWADLGCYGSRYNRTPNLDRLAASGRRFTQAYAACPVCSPTRAALMTGKHPARLHLTDWLPGSGDRPSRRLKRPAFLPQLPLEEVTIAERLKSAGYTTAQIGKWHLGGAGFEPTRQGFDVSVGGSAVGTTPSYFAPYVRNGVALPGLGDAPEGEYLTDRLTLEAERFLEAHRAEPFFLYLPHYAVHTPMVAKAEAVVGFPKWDGTPHGRQENPIYAAMLQSLDEGVGRVVAKLEALGLSSKTIVIFTSDNGGLATREGPNTPATINAPLREGKGWLYEGGIRVPLIVSWPGRTSPGVESTPCWSPDLFATIAELGGAGEPSAQDGVSLAGLLQGGNPPPDRPLYWHYPHYSNQGGRPGGAVRAGDWKLIEDYETRRHELFNVKKDPGESRNLAVAEPQKVEELAAKLDVWRKAVDAQMPTPNPEYSPNAQAADGVVTLPANSADVHGVMLRYEPLPHKNTLGYWVNADDWASWEFDLKAPGEFTLRGLIGCGDGSGGSSVEFRLAGQVLKYTVAETGGFQKFEPRELGTIRLDRPGRYTLEVHATAKPGPAVMDLRELKLVPR